MREVDINGAKFEVRGLRLSELSGKKARQLGYGRFFFAPDLAREGHELEERMAETMDFALFAVLGREGYARADEAGGVKALGQLFRAIVAETYGDAGEEKNSPSAGNGKSTPGASDTAPPAGA